MPINGHEGLGLPFGRIGLSLEAPSALFSTVQKLEFNLESPHWPDHNVIVSSRIAYDRYMGSRGFSATFKSRFLDNHCTDFGQNLSTPFSAVHGIRQFCLLMAKMGSKWRYLIQTTFSTVQSIGQRSNLYF